MCSTTKLEHVWFLKVLHLTTESPVTNIALEFLCLLYFIWQLFLIKAKLSHICISPFNTNVSNQISGKKEKTTNLLVLKKPYFKCNLWYVVLIIRHLEQLLQRSQTKDTPYLCGTSIRSLKPETKTNYRMHINAIFHSAFWYTVKTSHGNKVCKWLKQYKEIS